MCEPALDPQNNYEEEIAVIRIGRAVGSIPTLPGQESTGFGYYFNY
jgi:hypothetical protein